MNKLIPNIEKIVDAHIEMRDANKDAIITTMLDEGRFQILSNDETAFALNAIFEPKKYSEDIEPQHRFIKGKYYSLFESDLDELFFLDTKNLNKELICDIIVDVLVNVYEHPIGTDLQANPEIYVEEPMPWEIGATIVCGGQQL